MIFVATSYKEGKNRIFWKSISSFKEQVPPWNTLCFKWNHF